MWIFHNLIQSGMEAFRKMIGIVNVQCQAFAHAGRNFWSTAPTTLQRNANTGVKPHGILYGMPDDVIRLHVWPRLEMMSSAQDICRYRAVSRHWRAMVDSGWKWSSLKPFLVGIDRIPPWYKSGISLDTLMITPPYLVTEYHREQFDESMYL